MEMTMNFQLHIIVSVLLYLSVIVTDTGAYNYTNIIRIFFLSCGPDYLCNETRHSFQYTYDTSYKHLNLCPECSCDSTCRFNENCCPDIFFKQTEQNCEESIFLDSTPHSNTDKYPMVTTCPTTTENEIVKLCSKNRSAVERITNPPVTSKSSGLTYQNKYCAECHGEHDILHWSLNISCYEFSDFNYLSSYEEVVEQANRKQCTLRHEMNILPVPKCIRNYEYDKEIYYYKCNMTGYWESFDEDIYYSCTSTYVAKYRIFKNIFCYMCNPTKSSKFELIANCNDSGLWTFKDTQIEQACEHNAATSGTFPYKNIFCYMCNINTSDSDIFQDINVDISMKTEGLTFLYKISVSSLKYSFYMQLLKEQKLDNLQQHEQPANVNITNILLMFYARNPWEKGLCDTTLLPENIINVLRRTWRPCSCNPTDIYNTCLDTFLRHPPSCLSNVFNFGFIGTTAEEISAFINVCHQKSGMPTIQERCTKPIQYATDISSFLRVEDEHGNAYQNFDCFVCNNFPEINATSDIQDFITDSRIVFPYILSIRCNGTYLDFKRYISLFSIIRDAEHSGCRIAFDPFYNTMHKLNTCGTFSDYKCNSSGLLSTMNSDIKWACEGFSPHWYKEQFCALCNPSETPSKIVNSCNSSGLCQSSEEALDIGCKLLPFVYDYLPHKNIYCMSCNMIPCHQLHYVEDINEFLQVRYCEIVIDGCSCFGDGCVNPLDIPGVKIRNLFQMLENYKDYNFRQIQECREDQVLDAIQGVCINVVCYPGRYLLNGSICVPLFPVVSNIRYKLKFKTTAILNNGYNMFQLLHQIRKSLYSFIETKINSSTVLWVDFALLKTELSSLYPCSQESVNHTLEVIIVIDFVIKSPVIRDQVEHVLIKTRNSSFDFVNNIIISADDKEDTYSSTTDRNNSQFCQMADIDINDQHLIYRKYKLTEVGKLVTCPQVAFDSGEYIYDQTRNRVKVIRYNLQLTSEQFIIDDYVRVRICLEDILPYISNTQKHSKSTIELALEILTTVCTCISLLCLVLTFLAYCCFRSLRTLPGKNNMCLIFALAIAQACLQFGTIWTNYTHFCQTVGVVLHIFWLATFGCMNVCSYHMYKVFSILKPVDTKSRSNKQLVQYMMYSFGLPIIIVMTNVAVHLGISAGQQIGYGDNKCFISDRLSQIVSFILPIGAILLINIALFGVVAYQIHMRPTIQSTRDNRNDFIVYVKLFALTGFTWIGQIVDSFLPLSPFSFIVTLITGLQGVFIFLSYICNSRVYAMIMSVGRGDTESRTSGFKLSSGSSRKKKYECNVESTKF